MAVKNTIQLWKDKIKTKEGNKHKYDYGYVVVFAGPGMTGAASLAAISALRMGTGAVAVVAEPRYADIFRHFSPSFIVDEMKEAAQFFEHIEEEKRNTILIGPGAGQNNQAGLKKAVLDSLKSGKITVIDADAITAFKNNPDELFTELSPRAILTPHSGEFERLFPDIRGRNEEKALLAAKLCGAIVVLKGPETFIASPDGRIASSKIGNGWLATAGSGDVLAGIIAGISAWHEDVLFEAACAGVWFHGRAAELAGLGLISEDLPHYLPTVWQEIELP